jgi:hypothetical protein
MFILVHANIKVIGRSHSGSRYGSVFCAIPADDHDDAAQKIVKAVRG